MLQNTWLHGLAMQTHPCFKRFLAGYNKSWEGAWHAGGLSASQVGYRILCFFWFSVGTLAAMLLAIVIPSISLLLLLMVYSECNIRRHNLVSPEKPEILKPQSPKL